MSASSQPSPQEPSLRLQRYLSQCGLGSRRECEELIAAGRISIDGELIDRMGVCVNPQTQSVELDGERLKMERKKYYVLNKPPGYLCTAKDPLGRRVVLDLFPEGGPRLFTVGRLDENTTGLLIVTNDGDLAQKLAHPKHRIYRVYKAQVAGHPQRAVFDELKQGMFFTEGKFRVHNVKPIKKQGQSTWVEITMAEGQNREIRRLFARAGHKVMKLERISFGPIQLGRVAMGSYRELRTAELAELHAMLQRNMSADPAKERRSADSSEGKSTKSGRHPGSAARDKKSVSKKPSGPQQRRPSRSVGQSAEKTEKTGKGPNRGRHKPAQSGSQRPKRSPKKR